MVGSGAAVLMVGSGASCASADCRLAPGGADGGGAGILPALLVGSGFGFGAGIRG